MGKAAGYHLERQAFLLGLKLDISNPDWSADVVAQIRQLRTNWWQYRPVYMDKARLTNVPARVEARLHRGTDGRCFVTVDNVPRLTGATLRVNGNLISIPAPPSDPRIPALSILKVTAAQCGN